MVKSMSVYWKIKNNIKYKKKIKIIYSPQEIYFLYF